MKKYSNKKSKWQKRREWEASQNSLFDPEIHQLSREGYGFQMKRGYKEKPEDSAGSAIKHLLDKWSEDKK